MFIVSTCSGRVDSAVLCYTIAWDQEITIVNRFTRRLGYKVFVTPLLH